MRLWRVSEPGRVGPEAGAAMGGTFRITRLGGYGLVRVALGVILLMAAGLKAHQLAVGWVKTTRRSLLCLVDPTGLGIRE